MVDWALIIKYLTTKTKNDTDRWVGRGEGVELVRINVFLYPPVMKLGGEGILESHVVCLSMCVSVIPQKITSPEVQSLLQPNFS